MFKSYFKKVKKSTYLILGSIYFLLCFVMIYRMPDGYGRYSELKQRTANLEKEKAFQQEKMEKIKKKSDMLKTSSPFFVEMISREKLKMAKKGETIIKFSERSRSED